MSRFISYLRVSTDRQGRSNLGLQAQEAAIQEHLAKVEGSELIASYCEIESGRRSDRPELAKALDHAKRAKAVLIISKVDRLTRSARFLHEVLNSGVELLFCDLPEISGPAGAFMLSTMASVAELETALISQRTKAALAAARARGQRLGARPGASPLSGYLAAHGNTAGVEGAKRAADDRASAWRGVFEGMVSEGLSLSAMARRLQNQGDRTPRGGSWTAKACSRMIARLELAGC